MTTPMALPATAAGVGIAAGRQPAKVAGWFLAVVIVCQLGLLFPALAGLRVAWRMGAFTASLGLLLLLPGRARRFPAAIAAIWVLALLALEIFNPTSNSWLSATAEFVMYLATLAPLFWVSRLWIEARAFRLILIAMWLFYTTSAAFGLLQVYYPGRFQPAVSPVIEGMGVFMEGLKIYLPNGQAVFRPMGLTDTPGGAGLAGMWAILFGLGFIFTERSPLMRLVSLGGMVIGLMCIYLSQVREQLVVVGVWFVALMLLFAWRRMWRRFSAMLLIVAGIVAMSYVFTLSLGGQGIFQRLETLSRPSEVYENSRGLFLRNTLNELLPEYPLGGGMGRWGMMNYYFGNNNNPATGRVYVEIQLTGWVLDGGLPLVVLYFGLIGLAMWGLYRIALRPGPLRIWAIILIAYDIGTIAMAFDYTPFVGDAGLEFWFLNALMLTAGACVYAAQRARIQVPAMAVGAAPYRHA